MCKSFVDANTFALQSISVDGCTPLWAVSLIRRPSHSPVFDTVNNQKTGLWEGLGTRLVSSVDGYAL